MQDVQDGTALLHRLVELQARRRPSALAVISPSERVTYAELNRRANAIAWGLLRLGAGPEVAVGVRSGRSITQLAAFLGVLKTGAVYVPLELRSPLARCAALLRGARASILLTTAELDDPTARAAVRHTVVLDRTGDDAGAPGNNPAATVTASNLAYVTYTSGSTGEPKAVGTTHLDAVAYLRYLAASGHVSTDDTVLQLAPPSFDASVRDMVGTLAVGARLVMLGQDVLDPAEVRSALVRERITCLLSVVPSILRSICDTSTVADDDRPSLSVRRVLVSGERLTSSVLTLARRYFGDDTARPSAR